MTRSCSITGCPKPHHGRGLCKGHYASARRDGKLSPKQTVEERFWSKVNKDAPKGCWEWTSSHDGRYGTFSLNKRKPKAHRLSFEWSNGPIPDGMQIDHMCWNTRCVNPDHLRLASNAENNQNLSGARATSKSGVRGVVWSERLGKWWATSGLGGKTKYLGVYPTIEEAETAASDWRRENMPYSLMDHEETSPLN